jgi:hypothetical protein
MSACFILAGKNPDMLQILLILSYYCLSLGNCSSIVLLDDDVVCLSFADNVARFGWLNADEFNTAQQTEMLYTNHTIIFPSRRALLVLSGEMWYHTKMYNRFIDITTYPSLYKHYAIVSGIISFIFIFFLIKWFDSVVYLVFLLIN